MKNSLRRAQEDCVFVKRYRSHKGALAALAVSPAGTRCATMCADGTAKVYEVATFDMIVMLRLKFVPGALCFLSAGKAARDMLAISERDSPKIWMFDVSTGSEEAVACLDELHQAPVTAMHANAPHGTVRAGGWSCCCRVLACSCLTYS
jgi:peptidylprolyl isomerase domain and WD repeat-containing protein 1